MAVFNKFQDFIEQLGLKNHNLNTDTLKVFLTNEQPLVGDTVKGDMAEVTSADYPAGGQDSQNTYTESGGTGSCVGVDITWTAATATLGPFKFAVLYNNTGATKYLVGWWEYTTNLTLAIGESFKTDFGATMFTLGP